MKNFIQFFFTCAIVAEILLCRWFYVNHDIGSTIMVFALAMVSEMEFQANKIIDAIKKDDD